MKTNKKTNKTKNLLHQSIGCKTSLHAHTDAKRADSMHESAADTNHTAARTEKKVSDARQEDNLHFLDGCAPSCAHALSLRPAQFTLSGPKTSLQQQEAHFNEEIVPHLVPKLGFAHKHIDPFNSHRRSINWDVFFQNHSWTLWGKEKTKQKLSSSETLICERRQHRDTQACTEPESARGQRSCTLLDDKVLMASRVHGDVYSPHYCSHQVVPVPTSNIKLLCLT